MNDVMILPAGGAQQNQESTGSATAKSLPHRPNTDTSLRNSISSLKEKLRCRFIRDRREPVGGVHSGGEGVDRLRSPLQPYTVTEGGHYRSQSRNEANADGKQVNPPYPPPRSGGFEYPVIEGKKIRERDLHRALDVEDVVEGGPSKKGVGAEQLNPGPRSTPSISHDVESKSTQPHVIPAATSDRFFR